MITSSQDIALLVAQIRSGKQGRDQVLIQLYHDAELRRKVESVIQKHGGQSADYDSTYNNVLMQFVKTVIRKKDMEIHNTLHGYLLGIAKFVCLSDLQKQRKHQTSNIEDQYDLSSNVTPESLILDQSKIQTLNGLLEKLGRNCKEVLMYWANGYSMKEIATLMDYKSDMMAKKKKYKCFKELLKYLEDNPHIKQVLK